MLKRIHILFLLILGGVLSAQDNLPVTDNVQIEVMTANLIKNSKAQKLQVNISCNTIAAGDELQLKLSDATGSPILTSITRDGEALWLIQAENANDNPSVLSWSVTEDNVLKIFPGEWSVPYIFSLEIQLSLTDIINLENVETTRLDLILVTNGIESMAATQGRGNQITLKNTRE